MSRSKKGNGCSSITLDRPPYLTLATETSLLQAGPDALNPPSMLRVAVGVPTGALMLQHQCVIHKACSGAELKSEQCPGLSQSMPEGGPGQQKNSQEENWFLVQVYPIPFSSGN